jgi:hypothetical protein
MRRARARLAQSQSKVHESARDSVQLDTYAAYPRPKSDRAQARKWDGVGAGGGGRRKHDPPWGLGRVVRLLGRLMSGGAAHRRQEGRDLPDSQKDGFLDSARTPKCRHARCSPEPRACLSDRARGGGHEQLCGGLEEALRFRGAVVHHGAGEAIGRGGRCAATRGCFPAWSHSCGSPFRGRCAAVGGVGRCWELHLWVTGLAACEPSRD